MNSDRKEVMHVAKKKPKKPDLLTPGDSYDNTGRPKKKHKKSKH